MLVLLAGAIVGGVFAALGSGWRSFVWAALVASAAQVNVRVCRPIASLGDDADAASVARGERRLYWMTVLNTAAMGAGIWLNAAAGASTVTPFLATIVQVLYTLAAMINAGTHPRTFGTGAVINLGSVIVYWLTTGLSGLPVAVTVLGLLLLVTRFSTGIRSDFETSVRIRFENDDLVRRLQAEKREAEAQRALAESARQAADQARRTAEQANLAKSRFLASASHDLRQPLHTLMLFASLLDRADEAQRREFVQHIQSAAGSLNKLFGGLLDLSRLDAGAVRPDLSPVDVGALVTSLVDEIEPLAREKGLRIERSVADAVVVDTDPFLFERVLRNLLDNALKYTEAGFVRVSVASQADHALLVVSDSGIGMSEADQQRVFDEFFQVGNPGRDAQAGTGLGLAIVRRLCDLLGYRIALKSALGVGSSFEVVLGALLHDGGLRAAPPAPASEADEERSVPSGLSVLVVDDDRQVRTAMQQLLAMLGCEATLFDSMAALRQSLATPYRPDAAIVDYRLGGAETGADAVTMLRETWADLPVAVFSGEIDLAPIDCGTGAPVPVFQKPVDERVIRRWLAGAVSARPGPAGSAEGA